MIKVHQPSKNLGCLGLTVGKHYCDLYRKPHLGMYFHIHYLAKVWLSRYAIRWEGRWFVQVRFPQRYGWGKTLIVRSRV